MLTSPTLVQDCSTLLIGHAVVFGMVLLVVCQEVLHAQTMLLIFEIIAQAPTMETVIGSAVRLITRQSVASKTHYKRHI